MSSVIINFKEDGGGTGAWCALAGGEGLPHGRSAGADGFAAGERDDGGIDGSFQPSLTSMPVSHVPLRISYLDDGVFIQGSVQRCGAGAWCTIAGGEGVSTRVSAARVLVALLRDSQVVAALHVGIAAQEALDQVPHLCLSL